jgi:hypothetical protein
MPRWRKHALLLLLAPALAAVGAVASSSAPEDSPAAAVDDLPDQVRIKTRTQTFNSRSYFALKLGRIWVKANEEVTGIRESWRLLGVDGLPRPAHGASGKFVVPSAIVEISADADELAALSSDGYFYFKRTHNKSLLGTNDWTDGWGAPMDRLPVNGQFRGKLAWTIGRRNHDVLWHEDIDGNPHHYGTMGITTMYVLAPGGQAILFNDSGLPTDYSHRMCGPIRGRFRAESIAASASTMFVINRFGDMYTRLADFDTLGSNPMLFNYTFHRRRYPKDSGEDYRTNYRPWSLPSEGWTSQARIPLEGQARISRDITILQNGRGNGARELRVAGLDASGTPGYWSKPLKGDAWTFVPTGEPLDESRLLPADPGPRAIDAVLGPEGDAAYVAELDTLRLGKLRLRLEDFNLDCSPASLWVTLDSGARFRVYLHTSEAWTHRRRYDPGRDGTAKVYYGTIEIPDETRRIRDRNVQDAISRFFHDYDREAFAFEVYATGTYVEVRRRDYLAGESWELVRERSGLGDIARARLAEARAHGQGPRAGEAGLVVPDLHALKPADLPRLEAAIAANLAAEGRFAREIEARRAEARGFSNRSTRFFLINLLLDITKLNTLPKLRNISDTGDMLMQIYAHAREKELVAWEQDHREATDVLRRRIRIYREKAQELTRDGRL